MKKSIALVMTMALVAVALFDGASGADLTVIQTQKTKGIVLTLQSESGQWTTGKNAFVLELTSPDGKPVDAGNVALSTSMAMPGMAPMIAGATLKRDVVPGRYLGTISFPDRGARQVTVNWDGPAGKGSTRFSVPVR